MGQRKGKKSTADGFWKMETFGLGFKAMNIEEKQSGQRKEQNYKEQKKEKQVIFGYKQ